MKKILYSALSLSIIMLASCGGNEKQLEKKAEPIVEKVVPVEEEAVLEEEIEVSTDEASNEGDATAGKELFNSKGCVACHQIDTKTVGPSLKDIATAYTDNNDGLKAFLKEEGEAIVDPVQVAVMKPQLAVTKSLPDNELNNIVSYIQSSK